MPGAATIAVAASASILPTPTSSCATSGVSAYPITHTAASISSWARSRAAPHAVSGGKWT